MNQARRTFLALPLADVFLAEISSCLKLMRQNVEGVKWVRPENVHLTLHFFGQTMKEEIQKIKTLVIPHAATCPPLSLLLDGIGCFPNSHKPRVIWLGVSGTTARLGRLQGNIERDLEQAGFPVEKRPFHAHATLGRIKNFHPSQKQALSSPVIFPSTQARRIDRIILFESRLNPQGSIYDIIEAFELSGREAA